MWIHDISTSFGLTIKIDLVAVSSNFAIVPAIQPLTSSREISIGIADHIDNQVIRVVALQIVRFQIRTRAPSIGALSL